MSLSKLKNVYILLDHKIKANVYTQIIDENNILIDSDISYQWQHSNNFMNNYKDIEDAINPAYTLTSSDNYIRCVITRDDIQYYSNIIQVKNNNDKSTIQEVVADVVGKGVSLQHIGNESTGQSNISSDKDRINDCVHIALHTSKNEIPMIRYNNIIDELLFENVNDSMLNKLEVRVRSVLETYEPRIKVNTLNITYDGLHTVKVHIEYSIKNTNISSSFEDYLKIEN